MCSAFYFWKYEDTSLFINPDLDCRNLGIGIH